MEEKKGIRISLSIALLIIALIIIILLSIYIYIISNKYNSIREGTNAEEKNNNITSEQYSNNKNEISLNNDIKDNTDTTMSTSDNKENKLVQFDTEFFELSDIAKEYIKCNDIKNYKELNCDLDGDNIQDIVTIEKK